MPLLGKGMLISRMDIAPEHEEDFNAWYDREHLAERVAIPGFVEARRYVAIDASQKYLALYTTENFEVLDGPDYKAVLANQTEWSLLNISRLVDPQRAIARVSGSVGTGRACNLIEARLRVSNANQEHLRQALCSGLHDLVSLNGIISAHLLESDEKLSMPIGATAPTVGSSDWFLFVDCTSLTSLEDVQSRIRQIAGDAEIVSWGTYACLWDVSRDELDPLPLHN